MRAPLAEGKGTIVDFRTTKRYAPTVHEAARCHKSEEGENWNLQAGEIGESPRGEIGLFGGLHFSRTDRDVPVRK